MKLKQLTLIALAVCGLSIGAALLAPEAVFATARAEVCEGVGTVAAGGCSGGNAGFTNIVKVVVQLFATIIGIAAVVMVMVAGFKYVTAGGDSSKVGEAKNTILYAVIGLFIAASAQSIVWFVLNKSIEAANKKSTMTSSKTALLTLPAYYSIEYNNKNVV